MWAEVLIFVIAAVVLFELVEHVVIPTAAVVAARKRQPSTGAEGMVGKTGEVLSWSGTEGKVRVDGEVWRAESRIQLVTGDVVVVRAIRALTLEVSAERKADSRQRPAPPPARGGTAKS